MHGRAARSKGWETPSGEMLSIAKAELGLAEQGLAKAKLGEALLRTAKANRREAWRSKGLAQRFIARSGIAKAWRGGVMLSSAKARPGQAWRFRALLGGASQRQGWAGPRQAPHRKGNARYIIAWRGCVQHSKGIATHRHAKLCGASQRQR